MGDSTWGDPPKMKVRYDEFVLLFYCESTILGLIVRFGLMMRSVAGYDQRQWAWLGR